jgi:hypothetical protein
VSAKKIILALLDGQAIAMDYPQDVPSDELEAYIGEKLGVTHSNFLWQITAGEISYV